MTRLLRSASAASLFVCAVLSSPCAAQALVPFGPEFRVNTYTTFGQGYPVVAMNGTGSFVVVWAGAGSTDDSGVFGQRYDASGNPLGSEFRVNEHTTGFRGHPSIARDSLGDFIIVWESNGQDGSSQGVYGQLYSAAGVPQGEFPVNTFTTGSQGGPTVANDSTGAFVVSWTSVNQEFATSGNDVYARRYSAKGIALGGEFRVNSSTTGNQFNGGVAVRGGGFVVAYVDASLDGSGNGIAAQRFDATAVALGGPLRVNTYTTGQQTTPAVAFDPSGNFLVTWGDYGQVGPVNVFAQRYASSGATLGENFRLDTATTGVQKFPQVAADASGSFVVVWNSGPAGDYDVLARTVKPSGALHGGEVRINAFTTDSQAVPAVAAGPAGSFVVVWRSDNQASATSSGDIYARFLRPSGDADGNGHVDVADVFYLINSLFAGGPPPLGPANPDGIDGTDVQDVFYLINFLFAGGPPPV